MIKKMADDNVKFNLAVSLHSAINDTRSSIMPINDSNSLGRIIRGADSIGIRKPKRKVTYEYVSLERNQRQRRRCIGAWLNFVRYIPSKVNLIEYNPIDDGVFQQASEKAIAMYQRILEKHGTLSHIRKSRGKDIDAACGQLANKTTELN